MAETLADRLRRVTAMTIRELSLHGDMVMCRKLDDWCGQFNTLSPAEREDVRRTLDVLDTEAPQ